MTTDRDEIKKIIAEEKQADAAAKSAEAETSSIVDSIKGIGTRLDKMDEDFCSKFPDLCTKVDRLAEAIPTKVDESPAEGRAARKSDIDHVLFDDCPNCTPLREEVLNARGKRLADVDKAEGKAEEGGGEDLKTSPGYFPGSEWDDEKELYVERR